MKTMRIIMAVTALLLAAASLPAATLGYWRFEDGGTGGSNVGLDSSGNGLNLLQTVVNTPPTARIGPAFLNLSFPNTIPQTGITNERCINLSGGTAYLTSAGASTVTWPVLTNLTVEAFVRLKSILASTQPIISRLQNGTGNTNSWMLALSANTAFLKFYASSNTTAFGSYTSSKLSLAANKDYYVAAQYNAGALTFYLADLSSGVPVWQTETISQATTALPTYLASNSCPIAISEFSFSGSFPIPNAYIDEVRVSDQILPTTSFLESPGTNQPPAMVYQPNDASVIQGSNATFTAAISGLPVPSFQWYVVTNATTNIIVGATNTAFTVTSTTLSQSGNKYFIIATNISGSVTSLLANLEVILPSAATSPTVGYWRFESGGNLGLDSSTNGFNLSNVGTPVNQALPSTLSGLPGAKFPKTIPFSGSNNVSTFVVTGLDTNFLGTNYLNHADSALLPSGKTLTVEAYFNFTNAVTNAAIAIASQFNTLKANAAGWYFGLKELTPGAGDMALRLAISSDGTAANTVAAVATNWVLNPNVDYYAAAVFTNGTVTFFLQDMSGNILSNQIVAIAPTSIIRPPTDFRIGNYGSGAGNQGFPGIIDEVRLSRVALAPTSLMNPPGFAYPPSIVTPVQDVVVGENQNATFTVTATSLTLPLSYQWYSGASLISGATNISYTVTNALLAQNGNQYSVVVTNLGGKITNGPATLTVVNVTSPTVGYWRFENAGDPGQDYSGNNLALTVTNSFASTPYALPAGSGNPGEFFDNPIPLTSAANTGAFQQFVDGLSCLFRPDYPSFVLSNQITVEAYFNVSDLGSGGTQCIASQTANGGVDGWLFGVKTNTDTAGQLQIRLAAGTGIAVATNWIINLNNDYYAAAVFNAGNVTIYLKDLSNPTNKLQYQNIVVGATNIPHSTAQFRVGGLAQAPANCFRGLLDEVRVSRVALTPQQLLVPVTATTGVPANLTATAGDAQVLLTWNSVTNADYYNLKRSTNNGGPYTVIKSLTSTNFTDTNVVNGTTYYYVVSGYGVGGESANSTQASSTPAASVAPSPTILPVYLDGTGTNLVLRAATVTGHNYILQSTPGLETPIVWTPVSTNAGTGGNLTNSVPISPSNPKAFYRYLVQ